MLEQMTSLALWTPGPLEIVILGGLGFITLLGAVGVIVLICLVNRTVKPSKNEP